MYGYIHMVYELSDSASLYHITLYQSISGITAMHITEVAPVTQIRPLRPVAAAVQTSSAVKTAELQTQFVDGTCASWAHRLADVLLMLIDVRFVVCR